MKRQPAVFIGHGSPMNAITESSFSRRLREVGDRLRQQPPAAILMISAHWYVPGTFVTGMSKPRTIRDFYNFPKALYEESYPAPGSPELADRVADILERVAIDKRDWGFDHGTWTVLKYIFPEADVPVVQLSIDKTKDEAFYFEQGKKLSVLREEGVLLMGSGNIVHNLHDLDYSPGAKPFPWAERFDGWVKDRLDRGSYTELIAGWKDLEEGRHSIPTVDHYAPLIFLLGALDKNEQPEYLFEELQHGSLSMRSILFK